MAILTVSRKQSNETNGARKKISTDALQLELGDIISPVWRPTDWGFTKLDLVAENDVKRGLGFGLQKNELIIVGVSGEVITAYHRNADGRYYLLMAKSPEIHKPLY